MRQTRLVRLPQLDGMRAIAVSLVVLSHAGFGKTGALGVSVFFFLSGYLITSLMRAENLQTGTVSLRRFYIRRLLRIVPPLYLSLGLCAALLALRMIPPIGHLDGFTIFAQFAFFQNYQHLWGDPLSLPITGVWSLAVEEHFYLVFPWLYLLLLRHLSPTQQLATCLSLCGLALAFRCINVAILQDYSVNYLWTHTRIDAILFGSCLALKYNPALDEHFWRPKAGQAICALAAIILAYLWRNPIFHETFRYSVESAALYVLFAFALTTSGRGARLLSGKPAEMIARYSYTLYLVHVPIMMVMDRFMPRSHIVATVLAILLSFALAMLMYRLVERPISQLRHRLHRETIGDLEPRIEGVHRH